MGEVFDVSGFAAAAGKPVNDAGCELITEPTGLVYGIRHAVGCGWVRDMRSRLTSRMADAEVREGPFYADAIRHAAYVRRHHWRHRDADGKLTEKAVPDARSALHRALFLEGNRRSATPAEKSGGIPVGWWAPEAGEAPR